MTQIVYRANLSSAYFPLLSSLHGRSVVVGTSDNNFSRQLQSSSDLDKDIGIPQIYYAHNVLPTEQGLKSVAYKQRLAEVSGETDVTQIFNLRDDASGNKVYLAKTKLGFYVAERESTGYTLFKTNYVNSPAITTTSFPNLDSVRITTAHVQGTTYMCLGGVEILKFNFVTKEFNKVTLTGLAVASIIGITESNGYLVAYSTNSVAWSSLITPLDFVPSLETGAGGGSVEGAKGIITAAVPTADGFVIFTEFNAVSVLYTNNAVYPFQFNECTGAGGVTDIELISFEAQENNYAYTSKGLQLLKRRAAETILPAVTDFLGGAVFETFDTELNAIIETALTAPLKKKLSLISSRYFIISYGISSLTHAIVYDTVQKRMGKLKIDHVDCFEYELTDVVLGDLPKNAIAFLSNTGRISTVTFDTVDSYFEQSPAVVLLGKYQYVRSRFIELQKAELENVTAASQDVTCLVSWDGKNINSVVQASAIHEFGKLSTVGFGSPVGINHTLCIKNKFDLTSVVLTFTVHGASM